MSSFSSTPWVMLHQKGQTILDFNKAILNFNKARDDGVAVASAGP